ncbi:MAG: ATP-binding cassette domain-containing protein, partial [Fusobacteriaceae bacterium]|nr:ATP-binding cassette domain-containing protein [Fusobacteriaceae bacterium]
KEKVLRYCPQLKQNGIIVKEEFLLNWNKRILLITDKSILGKNVEFGLSWFMTVFKTYKKEFIDVLMGNFTVVIFSLFLPLITQTIIDKVLVHNSLSTLNVLTVIFALSIFLDFIIKISKDYILLFTTTKIDLILGKKLFHHLFHLPISYFENRSVGVISNRIKELENVREFLTGTPLSSFFDLLFIGLYLIFLWIFSPVLTGIIIVFIPVLLLFAYLVLPKYKTLIEERSKNSAEMEAFMIEGLSGVHAIKSFSLEPNIRHKWSNYQAKTMATNFQTNYIGIIYGITIEKMQKFLDLLLLIVGAYLVINKKLTVGQLIAFRMISSNLTNPLIKLIELIRDFEQIKISILNLGEILNNPTETRKQEENIRIDNANIVFKNVSFRYSLEGNYIIQNLNFTINNGEVVAFVGRSGSGKSTITKLIQKMYICEEGEITVNDRNIKNLNANALRNNIGVVMQENFLFNGSIRDNIAIKNQGADIKQIIYAAQLAGAHDFILDLEDGYDTIVGENGVGLSGGQKQRVAIARALLTNPKVLIFDEATSALDYESERIIMNNLKRICQGRTVIMIAHRLSTIKDANRIYVIEKGNVIESGSHPDLINRNGFYKYLHDLQKGEQ